MTQHEEKIISRREFMHQLIRHSGQICAVLAGGSLFFSFPSESSGAGLFSNSLKTKNFLRDAPAARFWISANAEGVNCLSCHTAAEKIEEKNQYDHGKSIVQCRLCAQECIIRPGERGKCRARMNVDGQLRSLVYGRPVSVHTDPIEKKPFYHFLPGSAAFSLGTAGCPLHCKFCQNWEISQASPEDFPPDFVPPERIARAAAERKAPVIAYTYNEPTVFAEYLIDTAKAAKKEGQRNVLISCGFMNPEPLDEMCDVLDAIKIDLKGFDKKFYRRVCDAELEPVLRSIRQIAKRGVHLEIVNLVVPTLNDSDEMLKQLILWMKNEVGPDVPLHFTRFHPDYQMRNLPPTPIATLERAFAMAKAEGLRYIYVGNVPGHAGNNTCCPCCGKIVIARSAFFVGEMHLKNGRCEYCDEHIAGVWN